MKARCWVGTSGWVYPHWRGLFYPTDLPQTRWFEHYAQHFATVEINNTFYQLPREATFVNWARKAPPGFLFAVKASRFITHVKRLADPQAALDNFLSRASLLEEHLGPILFQLPPRWHCNVERLESFLCCLPPGRTYVFEFRDSSWFQEEVFSRLEEHGAAFCIMSMPGLPCPIRATSSVVYLRMHGTEAYYGGKYNAAQLREWAGHLWAFLTEGRDVYVYFNNDAYGYAVDNARELRALLGQAEREGVSL